MAAEIPAMSVADRMKALQAASQGAPHSKAAPSPPSAVVVQQGPTGEELKFGWLDRARIGDRYDRRFCTLHADPAIAYYGDAERKDLKGCASLKEATLSVAAEKLQIGATDSSGKPLTLRFRAVSAEEAAAWGAAIEAAVRPSEEALPAMDAEKDIKLSAVDTH